LDKTVTFKTVTLDVQVWVVLQDTRWSHQWLTRIPWNHWIQIIDKLHIRSSC